MRARVEKLTTRDYQRLAHNLITPAADIRNFHSVEHEGFVTPKFVGGRDEIYTTQGPKVDRATQVDFR